MPGAEYPFHLCESVWCLGLATFQRHSFAAECTLLRAKIKCSSILRKVREQEVAALVSISQDIGSKVDTLTMAIGREMIPSTMNSHCHP